MLSSTWVGAPKVCGLRFVYLVLGLVNAYKFHIGSGQSRCAVKNWGPSTGWLMKHTNIYLIMIIDWHNWFPPIHTPSPTCSLTSRCFLLLFANLQVGVKVFCHWLGHSTFASVVHILLPVWSRCLHLDHPLLNLVSHLGPQTYLFAGWFPYKSFFF